jgi:hypothetical protein
LIADPAISQLDLRKAPGWHHHLDKRSKFHDRPGNVSSRQALLMPSYGRQSNWWRDRDYAQLSAGMESLAKELVWD